MVSGYIIKVLEIKCMTHKGTVTLETERLILRRFTTDDTEAMFQNFFSDPVAVVYSRWQTHEKIETTKSLIAQFITEYENPDCYNWVIVKRDTSEPIGRIAVSHLNERVSTADMSFFIGRAWWHMGYTSEALATVIEYLFTEIGVNRIAGRNDIANPNSGSVMKKCGMKFEGILRQAGKNSRGFVDVCQYAILAEDYIKHNNN
jgi:ribosomal-protein-alanine N-acetyltransferase